MIAKSVADIRVCFSAVGVVCLLFFVLFVGSSAFGQTTGTIVGTVSDASGSLVPGVTVTVTNEGTGAIRTLTTNDAGLYRAELLPVGTYKVQAEHSGFKTITVSGIILDVQQTVRTDIALQLGTVTEKIDVTSEVPLLKTDVSDVGNVITEKQIVELPLNGRNFIQLATLVPGTINVSQTDAVLQSLGGGIQTNGADSNGNNITLDGIENQDYTVPAPGVKLSPDATAEFKVTTSDYSAEYGRAAGAVIQLVTKAGTNEYRGNVFEFIRNNVLDAKNYFDAPNSKLPPFRQNQFGATFGGPIIKDKTFFFASYEGYRQAEGLTVNAILPTTAQIAGDLSSGPPIFDPLTTQTVNGVITRTQFPGNIIPTDRLDPTAQKALQLLWPTAQQQNPNVQNSLFHPSQTDNYDQWLVRIDHHLDQKDLIWGRFVNQKEPQLLPQFLTSGLPGQGYIATITQPNLVLGWTRTFSASMLNDMRFGFNRFKDNQGQQGSNVNYIGEIGINGALDDKATWGQPSINITGITSAGTFEFAPSVPVANTFNFNDTLSFIKGAHSLKVGVDLLRRQLNGFQYANSRGVYNFDTGFTNDPQNPATTGQGLADFLLGYPTSDNIILGKTNNDIRSLNVGYFVQDNWNIRHDLTLNLGLRYDYVPQPLSATDRFSNWDPAVHAVVTAQNNLNTVPHCAGCGNETLAQLEADFAPLPFMTRDQAHLGRSLVENDYNGWSPRVGFAWRMFGSKTVLRGGYGRFYEVLAGGQEWNQTAGPPFSRSESFSQNILQVPTLTLANPFPVVAGVQGVPGSGVTDPNYRNPHNDSWNLTLQREIRRGVSADVGYVGSRANNQLMGVDFNSPTFGIASIQQLRPDPTIGSTGEGVTWGHSWYDSLQARLQTQLKTLNISANYTWGHTITVGGGGENQNGISALAAWNFFGIRAPVLSGNLPASDPYLAIDKGPGAADIRHLFNFSYVWDLPFGKDRLVSLHGPADWIAGGWEFTGVTTFQTGFYLPLGCATCNRPNLLGNPNSGAPHTVQEWFNTSANLYATPPSTLQAFTQGLNPGVTLGDAGRAPIIGPPLQNWDIGIFKNFPFKERYRVQFRAEMFNAFNHPYFQAPNTTYGTATFGQISSAGPGREIQFGAKFYF